MSVSSYAAICRQISRVLTSYHCKYHRSTLNKHTLIRNSKLHKPQTQEKGTLNIFYFFIFLFSVGRVLVMCALISMNHNAHIIIDHQFTESNFVAPSLVFHCWNVISTLLKEDNTIYSLQDI